MKYPSAWQHDGRLRDIYIFDSNLHDWQKVVDFLRSTYEISYSFDDIDVPLPADARQIFQERNEHSRLLVIDAGGVTVHCHFFLEEEIEFDLDPRDVDTESKEEAVVRFMVDICNLLNKPVALTLEAAPNGVCLHFKPGQGEPEYTPHESSPGVEVSREEALTMMARTMGIDENDQQAVIERMVEAANRPHKPWRIS